LSGLEGLLGTASLEMTTKSVGAGTHLKSGGNEFQISGSATLKLRTPKEVRKTEQRTDGFLNKNVFFRIRKLWERELMRW